MCTGAVVWKQRADGDVLTTKDSEFHGENAQNSAIFATGKEAGIFRVFPLGF
jgi:hypothetical protein